MLNVREAGGHALTPNRYREVLGPHELEEHERARGGAPADPHCADVAADADADAHGIPKRDFLLIRYPGNVRSVANALETLGGLEGVDAFVKETEKTVGALHL